MAGPVINVRDLRTSFRVEGQWRTAVNGVSFDVAPNETVAIVGESGSGKSVTALSIMGLIPTANGRVEGEISLRKNNVTIGKGGRIKADVHGQTIHVEGQVKGNLYGEQEIVIRASGEVEGNIVSPRVTLENGSKFRGNIDMEPKPTPAAKTADKGAAGVPASTSSGPQGAKTADAQAQLKPSVSG